MYSYAVCSEAGQACSPATLNDSTIVQHSRTPVSYRGEGQYLQDVYPADVSMAVLACLDSIHAYFIVIRRHPVPVSMATQSWTMSALHRLFDTGFIATLCSKKINRV